MNTLMSHHHPLPSSSTSVTSVMPSVSSQQPIIGICEGSECNQGSQDSSLYTDVSSSFYQNCGAPTDFSNSLRNSFPALKNGQPSECLNEVMLAKMCKDVLRDMTKHGLCVIDNFLCNLGLGGTSEAIMGEVLSLYQMPEVFREGGLVNDKLRTLGSDPVRGDRITFVSGSEGCSNIAFLIRTLDTIITICSNSTSCSILSSYNIRSRTKAMVACYPGNGTQYVKHIDNPNRDGRVLTCIYYLNKGWSEQQGGILRLYPQGKDHVANIAPYFDRLIFFWSDRRNPHEVQRAYSVRFAITVWYFNSDEREEEMRRKKQEGMQICNTDQDLLPFPPFQKPSYLLSSQITYFSPVTIITK